MWVSGSTRWILVMQRVPKLCIQGASGVRGKGHGGLGGWESQVIGFRGSEVWGMMEKPQRSKE